MRFPLRNLNNGFTSIQIRSFHATMSSTLKQRSVVSSFICTSPSSRSEFTFALFKRSQDVSSYKGKWAVCSGSIDKTDISPAEAAKREIREETQLSDSDITLLRKGKPFNLIDEALQTEWTIYPFAWQLKSDAKEIQTDWEHTEYKFVKPEDLHNYDHVPQLEVGLERVLVSPMTERALTALRDDHESGAQALALKALEFLLETVRSEELEGIWSSEDYWKELRWRAWHLAKNGRPCMSAAIESKILDVLEEIEKSVSDGSKSITTCDLSRLLDIVETVISLKIGAGKSSLGPLAKHLADFLDVETSAGSINITTISSSGTIKAGLLHAIPRLIQQGIQVKLTVMETRPSFEGASFVNNVLEEFKEVSEVLANLKIEIVSDATVALAVKNGNVVVFGGDKVISNGDVSNKMGSFSLAAMAKTVSPNCKVIAVFETSKITSPSFESEHLAVEENDSNELMDSWPLILQSDIYMKEALGARIKIRNEYFEWVPAKFIDLYITEKGIWDVEDIARRATENEEREKRLFGDL